MDIFIGEFFGTMVLILLGDGVVANVLLKESKGENSGWIVIASGWGMAVAMGVYISGWISGAHINPAVTIALAAVGSLPLSQIPVYITAQFAGAFTGAVLVWLVYLPHWKITENPNSKLSVFCTIPAIRHNTSNFISEFIGTAMLMIGVLGIGIAHNQLSSGMGPFTVGLLVLAIGLSLGGPTGYAINPARDLAPRIAHAILPIPGKRDSDWQYAWIPIVAPIMGGIFGAVIYTFFIGCCHPL